jgi:hypothetical protein
VHSPGSYNQLVGTTTGMANSLDLFWRWLRLLTRPTAPLNPRDGYPRALSCQIGKRAAHEKSTVQFVSFQSFGLVMPPPWTDTISHLARPLHCEHPR